MSSSVIILGAPRSGTNMLRDILVSFDSICTWPCDEINYIWRHGNLFYPSDEIPPERATPYVRKYIRDSFNFMRDRCDSDILVEKTCANSLRVPFVRSIIPDAKYIFIYRDGIDVTGSAKDRWTATLDLNYILKKVRFIPIVDLPVYAVRYIWSRVFRLFSSDKRLAFWGPSLNGMDEILKKHTLNEVCALQWRKCVENTEEALLDIPEDMVIRVQYENFVRKPVEELSRILAFLNKSATPEEVLSAIDKVSSKSIGKGRQSLGEEEVKHLESLVGDTLNRYGYLHE